MQVFPFRSYSKASYKECPRAFGCPRGGGRKHAGIDLYFPVGEEVLAISDGKIIQPAYFFYLDTWALEIEHENGMVIRYGEIQARTPRVFRKGDHVAAGEVIGYVGRLKGLSVSMLHLECYSGTEKGPLTVRGNVGFQRRKDLIDPTSYIDSLELPPQ